MKRIFVSVLLLAALLLTSLLPALAASSASRLAVASGPD